MTNDDDIPLVTQVHPCLWLGGSWLPTPPDVTYDIVVTVCHPFEVADSPPSRLPVNLALDDAGYVDVEAVDTLCGLTVQATNQGLRTLVRCALGLNRSALVVALALVDLTGDDPATVIAALRRKRSPQVLFNPAFERYVLQCDFRSRI